MDDSKDVFPLFVIWQRLKRLLGLPRPNTVMFEADTQLVKALQELAKRDKRSEEEVAADLLAYALDQRQSADENLASWQELSPRERDIAALTCIGLTNRQIAARLYISPETVKTHMRNLLRKFNAHSKSELRHLLADWDFSAWEKHTR